MPTDTFKEMLGLIRMSQQREAGRVGDSLLNEKRILDIAGAERDVVSDSLSDVKTRQEIAGGKAEVAADSVKSQRLQQLDSAMQSMLLGPQTDADIALTQGMIQKAEMNKHITNATAKSFFESLPRLVDEESARNAEEKLEKLRALKAAGVQNVEFSPGQAEASSIMDRKIQGKEVAPLTEADSAQVDLSLAQARSTTSELQRAGDILQKRSSLTSFEDLLQHPEVDRQELAKGTVYQPRLANYEKAAADQELAAKYGHFTSNPEVQQQLRFADDQIDQTLKERNSGLEAYNPLKRPDLYEPVLVDVFDKRRKRAEDIIDNMDVSSDEKIELRGKMNVQFRTVRETIGQELAQGGSPRYFISWPGVDIGGDAERAQLRYDDALLVRRNLRTRLEMDQEAVRIERQLGETQSEIDSLLQAVPQGTLDSAGTFR